MKYTAIQRALDTAIRLRGGCTLSVMREMYDSKPTIDFFKPETGYQVGVKALVEETYSIIKDEHIALIKKEADNGKNIGLWLNDGKLYIDVSIHIADKALALSTGLKNGEIAIWDWAEQKEILV